MLTADVKVSKGLLQNGAASCRLIHHTWLPETIPKNMGGRTTNVRGFTCQANPKPTGFLCWVTITKSRNELIQNEAVSCRQMTQHTWLPETTPSKMGGRTDNTQGYLDLKRLNRDTCQAWIKPGLLSWYRSLRKAVRVTSRRVRKLSPDDSDRQSISKRHICTWAVVPTKQGGYLLGSMALKRPHLPNKFHTG